MKKLRFYRQTGTLDRLLNTMSRKGFALKRAVLDFYLFSSCTPGAYVYRTAWIFGMKREERRQLIERMSRVGAVPAARGLFWICFRGEETFSLYQNRMQQAESFGRLRSMLFLRSLFFALAAAGFLSLGLRSSSWWLLGTAMAGTLCIWDLFSSEDCRNRAKELDESRFLY